MEAKGLVQHGASSLLPSTTGRRGGGKRCPAVVVAAAVTREIDGKEVRKGATVYEDMWFSRLAIRHLSQSVQTSTGFKNDKEGYESLIEAAAMVSQNFNTNKQQELVIQALHIAFPKPILSLIKRLLPSSKFTREFFAVFTTVFFAWLVGHCEVKESEFEGRKERNVVHIPKCRFLEGSKCVGMCVNLCKIPSQRFIEESFGIPVSMTPNFEDMSCDMVFGLRPPAAGDDPSTKQPCYSLCKAKQQHFTKSSSS